MCFQMHFDVASTAPLKTLMDSVKHMLKEKYVSVILKRIKTEQDSKVDFAIGPRVKVVSIAEDEKEFSEDYRIYREDFQFRKRKQYEKISIHHAWLCMHQKIRKKK